MSPSRSVLFLMLFFAILTGGVASSEPNVLTFRVRGSVTDPVGRALQGVEVRFQGQNVKKIVCTDQAGHYEADLPVGIYTMAAQHPGFKPYHRPMFRVITSADVTFNLILGVGNIINRGDEADPKKYDSADLYRIPSGDGVPFEVYIRYGMRTPNGDLIAYDGYESPFPDPVFVAYDLFSLRATHVNFDVAHSTLEASGNVVAELQDGTVLKADKSSYRFENGHAIPVR